MNTYGEDKIRGMIEGSEIVRKLVKDLFWDRYRNDPQFQLVEDPSPRYPEGEKLYDLVLEAIHYEEDEVRVWCMGDDRCGNYTGHNFTFPLAHLWLGWSSLQEGAEAPIT